MNHQIASIALIAASFSAEAVNRAGAFLSLKPDVSLELFLTSKATNRIRIKEVMPVIICCFLLII